MDGCNLKLCLHEKGLNIQLNPNLLLGYDFQLHTTNKSYAIKYFLGIRFSIERIIEENICFMNLDMFGLSNYQENSMNA